MEGQGSHLKRPKVIANFAITWDGRISTRNRTPSDFSSPRDKKRLLEIRSEGDAVVASAGTVAADTMTMGLPDRDLQRHRVAKGQSETPIRVLVSGSGNVSPRLRLFEEKGSPVILFTTRRMSEESRAALGDKAEVRVSDGEMVDLSWMLGVLWREFEVKVVVFEGGGKLFKGMLAGGLVDELCLTLCPRIFWGPGISLTGPGGEWFEASVGGRLLDLQVIGGECFTRWKINF